MSTTDDIECPVVFWMLVLLALLSAAIMAIGIVVVLMQPEHMIGG